MTLITRIYIRSMNVYMIVHVFKLKVRRMIILTLLFTSFIKKECQIAKRWKLILMTLTDYIWSGLSNSVQGDAGKGVCRFVYVTVFTSWRGCVHLMIEKKAFSIAYAGQQNYTISFWRTRRLHGNLNSLWWSHIFEPYYTDLVYTFTNDLSIWSK